MRAARIAVAAVLITIVACDAGHFAPKAIDIMNGTDSRIIVIAVEREESNLFDPNPAFTVAIDDPRVIDSGASFILHEADVQGPFALGEDDLRLFIYKVEGTDAVLARMMDVAGSELSRRSYRLEIESLSAAESTSALRVAPHRLFELVDSTPLIGTEREYFKRILELT